MARNRSAEKNFLEERGWNAQVLVAFFEERFLASVGQGVADRLALPGAGFVSDDDLTAVAAWITAERETVPELGWAGPFLYFDSICAVYLRPRSVIAKWGICFASEAIPGEVPAGEDTRSEIAYIQAWTAEVWGPPGYIPNVPPRSRSKGAPRYHPMVEVDMNPPPGYEAHSPAAYAWNWFRSETDPFGLRSIASVLASVDANGLTIAALTDMASYCNACRNGGGDDDDDNNSPKHSMTRGLAVLQVINERFTGPYLAMTTTLAGDDSDGLLQVAFGTLTRTSENLEFESEEGRGMRAFLLSANGDGEWPPSCRGQS